MKNIKKYFSLFIVAAFLLLGLQNVNAVDSTITFHKRNLSGVDQYSGSTTSYKYVDTSAGTRIGFCLNKVLAAPAEGSKLKLDKELTTPSLVYILNNGYGGSWNSSILKSGYTNDEKYYITQLAIWLAQGSLKTSALNSTGRIGSQALALYNAAAKATLGTPKISLAIAGNAMALSSDGKNYVSNDIKLGGSNYSTATITLVNVPADARIVVDGAEKTNNTKIAPGKSFKVSIPASKVTANMNIQVKASAVGNSQKIYRYTSGSSSYQNIGLMYNNTSNISTSTNLTLSATGNLRVVKVDATANGANLAGAKITVKNSAGTVVGTWTTDTNPHVLNNLPIGVYTVIEESAPAGYYKASDINVTVKAGQTVEVKMENTKTPSKVKISKQDITTKAELPGAHLVLKNALGQVVDEWDSTTTPHYIATLTPGKYTLSETVAPEGYLVSSSTVSFVVESDGGVEKPVVMYNSPIPDNTLIKISKRDITNEKEVPGAKLVVKDAEGNVVDEWISTTEPHYLADLKAGKYQLIETQSPKGYGISDDVIEFEVTADGGIEKVVVMYNSPIPNTAGMNVTLVVAGLIATFGLAGFSIFKLNKQNA